MPWVLFPQSLSRVLRDVQQELGTDSMRERAGDCRGEGDRRAPQEEMPPPRNTAHSKAGPRQLEWMAQLGFPSEEGAEDPF